ncbi:MAG: ABC transporter ATP-binding protein [Bdellovibrionales bacterium]|nr:ABC transporter ATP-binding protein [Bdellovibrionales bacterium]
MGTSVIELKDVSKNFSVWKERPNNIKSLLIQLTRFKVSSGQRTVIPVLKNISFSIQEGDFVGIMGRNGVGKSTLLKLITGIYTPTEGSVITKGSIVPLLELGAGFHHELTGYENIFLNAAILGFGRKQILGKARDIIEFSELEEHIDQCVRNYSSGMLMRLGFSIAAHLDADIFLFDEILAVGDVGFQNKCLKKIHELNGERGKTVILVTHNPDQVLGHCSRCIVFDHSEVTYDGPPDAGIKTYNILNTGSPALPC